MGAGESALDCFYRMQNAGCAPTLSAYSAAIRACASRKLWPVALSLLEDLHADGLRADTPVYNAALVACERGGQLEEAELLLKSMMEDGPAPNTISYNTIISTAARLGLWQRALALLSDMEAIADAPPAAARRVRGESSAAKSAVRPDVYSYTTAISACERGGEPSAALDTFARMQARDVAPNTFAYNAAIRAAATRKHWPIALSLLEDMRSDGVPLDLVSYNVALAACERAGEVGHGRHWLEPTTPPSPNGGPLLGSAECICAMPLLLPDDAHRMRGYAIS